MSRIGTVAVISRFAVLWMTRAKWDCLDDSCKLTRADSASDEAIVSEYWFKRWNSESDWSGESDWNGGSDWISLCIRDKCWSRRSSRRNDAGLACANVVARITIDDKTGHIMSLECTKHMTEKDLHRNLLSVRDIRTVLLHSHR